MNTPDFLIAIGEERVLVHPLTFRGEQFLDTKTLPTDGYSAIVQRENLQPLLQAITSANLIYES